MVWRPAPMLIKVNDKDHRRRTFCLTGGTRYNSSLISKGKGGIKVNNLREQILRKT